MCFDFPSKTVMAMLSVICLLFFKNHESMLGIGGVKLDMHVSKCRWVVSYHFLITCPEAPRHEDVLGSGGIAPRILWSRH